MAYQRMMRKRNIAGTVHYILENPGRTLPELKQALSIPLDVSRRSVENYILALEGGQMIERDSKESFYVTKKGEKYAKENPKDPTIGF